MEMLLLFLLPFFIAFILWLGSIILDKAGFDRKLVFFLLFPVINIIMIWALAFTKWPNLKDDVDQY